MITKSKTRIEKNADNKKIIVTKSFDADVQQVWDAWTTNEKLDKWWAPNPWRAVTQKMDFKEDGYWLYKMAGPKGEVQWAKMDFNKIEAPNYFTATDSFTDESGARSISMPTMQWKNSFTEQDGATQLRVEINFNKKEDMEKILKTGFEKGFSAALDNLEELLAH